MDVRTLQNWLNRLPDDWNSPQSPDELVIQKRGRRKSIVWSPDLDIYKRRSLLSSSSRDRTPVKSPSTSNAVLRDTARKRLSLIDTRQSSFATVENKKTSLPSRMSLNTANTPREQSNDNLANGLRGLSHEQLVQLIMELVCAQDNGVLRENERLRSVLSKKMPVADIQPLIEKLIILRQNIYSSLVFVPNLTDDSTYSRAYIHLDSFQKTLIDQGKILQKSQHWISLMRYALEAWRITRELPEWENQGSHNVTRKCFKSLSQFCTEAIRRGNFETSALEIYIEREMYVVLMNRRSEFKSDKKIGLLFDRSLLEGRDNPPRVSCHEHLSISRSESALNYRIHISNVQICICRKVTMLDHGRHD